MKKIIVIGGGISGMIAAIYAKNNNNEVTILERNNVCGKKILVTGNGRCNYANSNYDIKNYHTSSNSNLDDIINETNILAFLDFYKEIGIIPKIKNGYYYPYSNQAVTVQQALIKETMKKNIIIKNDIYVESVIRKDDGFVIRTHNEIIDADIVIIACGGKSYPKLGTDGNGYNLLESLGHKIKPVVPALTQIRVSENIKDLSGVRSECLISLIEDNKDIHFEKGEIQFTDYGISGICSMQLSRYVSYGLLNNKIEKIAINFIYDIASNIDEFNKFIESNHWQEFEISRLLDSLLNYKLTNYILKVNKIDGNKKVKDLNQKIFNNLVNNLINFTLHASGTNTFDNSQVSAGGVDLEEINLKNMKSKIVPNLYVVGEVLDIDGNCGGYNITFSSISGMLAGMEINKND